MKGNQSSKKSLARAAFHESGHAVMICYLKRRFRYVTIIPNDDEGYLGACVHCRKKHNPRGTKHIEDQVLISLAGPIAEKVFSGRENSKGSRADWDDAKNMARLSPMHNNYGSTFMEVSCERKVLVAYLEFLDAKAELILAQAHVWDAVKKLAEELLTKRKISYLRVKRIVNQKLKGVQYLHLQDQLVQGTFFK